MAVLHEVARRVRMLLQGSRAADELDEEMRLHVALREEQLRSQGLSADAARDAAQRRFGNILRLREESVDAWGWRWLEQFVHDVRFGLRTLRKNPGFTATAVITLGLATGATTAIFSIVDSVLLRPLPFADPERLVQVYGRVWRDDRPTPDPMTGPVGSPELEAYTKQSTSFAAFAGHATTTRHLQGPGGLERLTAVVADFEFFPLLGVQPIAGRTFSPGDPPEVAVISANLWRRQFALDPSLPGKSITVDGRPFTVLGVMPDTFQFPYSAASVMPGALPESRTDLWIPLQPLRAGPTADLRQGRVSVVGRLGPGVSVEAAQAELNVIARRVEAEYRGDNIRVGARVAPLADDVVGPVRRSLWLLFTAVGLVLAAACANVANLLLARATIRTREVSIRAALGAGRLRLVRLFLAESLLLSLAGGALGLVIASWGTSTLVALGSAMIPRAHEIGLDWRVFAFLLIACIVTAIVVGLAPALTAARADLQNVTKESGGHATMGPSSSRIRDALVIAEMSLAFVLALGAAIVMREVIRLQNVETGMVTDNVLTLHLTPRAPARDYYAIEERVARLPGVQAAGFTQLVPLQNWGWEATFGIRGRPASGERPVAGLRYVTPGYFRTLGIPVVEGRGLDERDHADAPRVILINEALARRYFPGEDAVGKETDRGTIVGVVRDVRNIRLDRGPDPELYYPAAQNVTMASDIGMSLLVRSAGPPEPLIGPIRAAVRDINSNLAIFNVKRMDHVLEDSLWELNLYRWLIGLFAALALALAAIGIYGVIAYTATARTREFAIRVALGSNHGAVARLVLKRGFVLTAAGLALGASAAVALMLAIRESPLGQPDPAAFAGIAALLLAMSLIACAVPAIRVAGVNPVSALRQE